MSIDNKKIALQVEAYSEVRHLYEKFAGFLAVTLKNAVKNLGMNDTIVTARAKGIPNFVEKAVRRQDRYPDPINQFDDLCGARIIVNFLDEIEPVCNFIRKYFAVNEAESEDVGTRLNVSQFGYRSIHFTVSLDKEKTSLLFKDLNLNENEVADLQLPEELFSHYSEKECRDLNILPSARFRAEVQVRTILAHAWAVCAHDLVYKSDFDVPDILKRDTNRIAAALESIDNDFLRTVHSIKHYQTYFGPYMENKEREIEIEKLKTIIKYDPGNEFVAYEIARLFVSLEDWPEVLKVLKPFVEKWKKSAKGKMVLKLVDIIKENQNPEVIADAHFELSGLESTHFSRIFQEYGKALAALEQDGGLEYLEAAIHLDNKNSDACVDLARLWYKMGENEKAIEYLENAYRITPADPRILGEIIQNRIIEEKNTDFVSLLKPSLENGIQNCRDRALVGIYIPYAFYDIGLFALLLGRPYESLEAFCLAVIKSTLRKDVEDFLNRIEKIKKALTNSASSIIKDTIEQVRMLLLVSLTAKKFDRDKNPKSIFRNKLDIIKTRDFILSDQSLPIRIVAGGCDRRLEKQIQEYCTLINIAFEGYYGVIFSGGTMAGISRLVGDISPEKGKKILKLAYLPNIPPWTKVHDSYKVFYSGHSGFSAYESLQQWVDLIANGIEPSDVKVLGINGGKITAFEFHLALTLGAKVGIIRDSGRAANEICNSVFWKNNPNLITLPKDPQTVRNFIQIPPPSVSLAPQDRIKMAQDLHKEYQKKHVKDAVKLDPSIADWDHLSEDLKDSNLQQIDHIEEKLRSIGYGIRKSKKADVKSQAIPKEKIKIFAEMEHGRWNVERLMKGWRLGDEKDVQNRISPYIVPWKELSDQVKEWDYDGVNNSLASLDKYGYEIYKIE